jgi:tetratricopeptide (TPR) repeat protein
LAVCAAGLWWIRPVLLNDGSAGFGAVAVTPWQYFRSQPGVIVHYLRLVAWPNPLCLDYGWPVENRWLEGILLPGLLVSGLFIASVFLAVRRPALGFPGMAFFLILAPTSSFVPIQDLAFEHRMYLPSAVLLATAVVGVYAALRTALGPPLADAGVNEAAQRDPAAHNAGTRLPRSAELTVAMLVLAAAISLGWATWQRNRVYHSAAGMWQDVLAKVLRRGRPATHLPRLMANLGLELHKAGRTDEALEVFQEGLRATPGSTAIRANYAQALIDLKRFDEASEQLARVLEVEPRTPRFVHQAALVAARAGRLDEAETLFRRVIAVEPRTADYHVNLAQLLFDRERWSESLKELAAAAELYGPRDPRRDDIERRMARAQARTHFEQGNMKRRAGDWEAARVEYERTVALDPSFAPAHNNLGGLAMSQSPAAAARHFANAVEQAPDYVEARFNLALALLRVGQTRLAIEHLQRIVATRPDFTPAQQTLRMISKQGEGKGR